MFLVVMSTTWWASSLELAADKSVFNEAMDDIKWVIDQIMEPPPISITPGVIAQEPSSPSGTQHVATPAIPWFVRTEGKRRPKPTRKLLGV